MRHALKSSYRVLLALGMTAGVSWAVPQYACAEDAISTENPEMMGSGTPVSEPNAVSGGENPEVMGSDSASSSSIGSSAPREGENPEVMGSGSEASPPAPSGAALGGENPETMGSD